MSLHRLFWGWVQAVWFALSLGWWEAVDRLIDIAIAVVVNTMLALQPVEVG